MVTLVNRAKVATATTGTGTITLGAAESGYQTFADAGLVDTNVVRYVIEDGTAWEIGSGTYTASGTTLSRTPTESSGGGSAITLTGNAVVFISATAADLIPAAAIVTLDDTNLVVSDTTNLQTFAEGVDSALLKARGTGVTSTYVSTAAAGGTTFAQPAVEGEINSDQGYFSISYAGATGITVANLTATSTYVYIDNAGNLQQQTTVPTRQDWSRKVFTMRIGVDTTAGTILGFEYLSNPIGHYANSIRDLYTYLLAQGIPLKKDQTVTGRAGDLGFDVSAGSLMEFGGTGNINNANIKSFNAVANASYTLLSRTAIVSVQTDLVKFWDNAGTITALGSTTVVGHRLFRYADGALAMQYGQGNYANMSLAKAGVVLENYVLNPLLKDATFFGWWLIESTATNTGGTTLTNFAEYTIGIQGGSSGSLAGCLLIGNNLSDLQDAPTARTNLGLGDFPTTLGSAAQVLTVNAGATAAEWAAAGGGGTALYSANEATPAAQPNSTGGNAVAIGDSATASGADAFGIGLSASASGNFSVAIGRLASATTNYTLALGYNSDADGSSSNSIGINTTASSSYSTSLGASSVGSGATTATGSGAMALGGSYASGTDSFAAAIANNTSSYGATGANSVAMGDRAKSTTTNAIAIGDFAQASGTQSPVAIGVSTDATASYSAAFGYNAHAQGEWSIAVGGNASAVGSRSTAIGVYANAALIQGAIKLSNSPFSNRYQNGVWILSSDTSDATPKAISTNTFSAGSNNQIIPPNNSAFAFSGTIIARQSAATGTASAAWKIEGLIRREGSAGTTVLVNSATTVLDNTPAWGMALTADTTNGGLAITVTGAAATNIRWVATINTSEVTY